MIIACVPRALDETNLKLENDKRNIHRNSCEPAPLNYHAMTDLTKPNKQWKRTSGISDPTIALDMTSNSMGPNHLRYRWTSWSHSATISFSISASLTSCIVIAKVPQTKKVNDNGSIEGNEALGDDTRKSVSRAHKVRARVDLRTIIRKNQNFVFWYVPLTKPT